jgi:hypothetical protein
MYFAGYVSVVCTRADERYGPQKSKTFPYGAIRFGFLPVESVVNRIIKIGIVDIGQKIFSNGSWYNGYRAKDLLKWELLSYTTL